MVFCMMNHEACSPLTPSPSPSLERGKPNSSEETEVSSLGSSPEIFSESKTGSCGSPTMNRVPKQS